MVVRREPRNGPSASRSISASICARLTSTGRNGRYSVTGRPERSIRTAGSGRPSGNSNRFAWSDMRCPPGLGFWVGGTGGGAGEHLGTEGDVREPDAERFEQRDVRIAAATPAGIRDELAKADDVLEP